MTSRTPRLPQVSTVVVIIAVWLFGSASTLSLALEFPAKVFSIHLRTYPGMFLWPVFFLPIVMVFLVRPLRLLWRFISERFAKPRLAKLTFVLPVVGIAIGMSGYEWFNGKFAIWEVGSDYASAQPPVIGALASEANAPEALRVDSFNEWALSIRSRPSAGSYLRECRFGGEDLQSYREGTCYCAPFRARSTGAQCDTVRRIWYRALGSTVSHAEARSYTYYVYRMSFTVMAAVFLTAFLAIAYMVCFTTILQKSYRSEFSRARIQMHVVALFCVVWWMQRIYFGHEQFKIFPIEDDSVFLTYVLSFLIGVPIIIATVYAFGQKVQVVKSFMDNLFFPILTIASAAIGFAAPEMATRIFRVTFGVNASIPAMIAFLTFSFALCLIPLFQFLRDSGFRGFELLKRGRPQAPRQSGPRE